MTAPFKLSIQPGRRPAGSSNPTVDGKPSRHADCHFSLDREDMSVRKAFSSRSGPFLELVPPRRWYHSVKPALILMKHCRFLVIVLCTQTSRQKGCDEGFVRILHDAGDYFEECYSQPSGRLSIGWASRAKQRVVARDSEAVGPFFDKCMR